jgi:hypothetical protein
MKNILKITSALLLFTVFLSCSEDENPADNFLGTQDVTITFNGVSYPMKAGEYYDSQGTSNSEITRIECNGNSTEFGLTLDNSENFGRFGFNYKSSFNGEAVAVGQTVVNPWFFGFTLKLANGGSIYTGAMLGGESNTAGIFETEETIVTTTNVTLVINERVSNGTEQVIDGVRQDYPLERVSGVLSLDFVDYTGDSQNLTMDFSLEGINIVNEPDEFIFTDPSNGGGDDDGGSDCGNLTYNGPTEGQAAQWCANAQILQCIDDTSPEYNYQCQVIEDYGVNCPYCD